MSKPYQSRVFTFVTKRANQLKDSCAKGLRHLKVAVVWSGQILLSPLHWLAQATKIFQPQLPPPRPQPILTSQPVSDINIEQALELVEVAGYPILLAPATNRWQAVRADLELTQTSVPTVDRAVAEPMLRYRATANTAVETQPHDDRVTAPKPTIRGLGSLLVDRQLVLVTTENEILDILSIAQQQEIRRRIGLDIALAWHQWQTIKLSGDLNIKQLSGNDRLLFPTDNNLLGGAAPQQNRQLPPQNLFERLTDWFNQKQPQPQDSPLVHSEDRRAIAQTYPQRLPPAKYSFTPQPPALDRYLDLPQLPPIKSEDRVNERDNPISEFVTKFQPSWFKRLWSYYRDYVYIPAPTARSIVYQPPQEFELIPIDSHPNKIVADRRTRVGTPLDRSTTIHRLQDSTKLTKQARQNLEYQPDWIEAISEKIGYSQTPFARFLAWLDRLVLAIENWLIELWNKIVNSRSAN